MLNLTVEKHCETDQQLIKAKFKAQDPANTSMKMPVSVHLVSYAKIRKDYGPRLIVVCAWK